MSEAIHLTEDGGRALQEAENLCWRANVAILSAEHLLAGTLLVLAAQGVAGMPAQEAFETALLSFHGLGEEALTQKVMWGSAARDALNASAARLAQLGQVALDARELALGLLESGEVNPMFYGSLGTTRDVLRAALSRV